jgi:hypothetical protein
MLSMGKSSRAASAATELPFGLPVLLDLYTSGS